MATWSREVFSKNLQKYIERSGKSQKELAIIIGVSAPTMHDWVKGKKFPRIDKIEMLADYFGILKSDLIEEKNFEINPKAMAERHFEMVMDEDLNDIFEDFRSLNPAQRKIVKDLIHNLAETKAEV